MTRAAWRRPAGPPRVAVAAGGLAACAGAAVCIARALAAIAARRAVAGATSASLAALGADCCARACASVVPNTPTAAGRAMAPPVAAAKVRCRAAAGAIEVGGGGLVGRHRAVDGEDQRRARAVGGVLVGV